MSYICVLIHLKLLNSLNKHVYNISENSFITAKWSFPCRRPWEKKKSKNFPKPGNPNDSLSVFFLQKHFAFWLIVDFKISILNKWNLNYSFMLPIFFSFSMNGRWMCALWALMLWWVFFYVLIWFKRNLFPIKCNLHHIKNDTNYSKYIFTLKCKIFILFYKTRRSW